MRRVNQKVCICIIWYKYIYLQDEWTNGCTYIGNLRHCLLRITLLRIDIENTRGSSLGIKSDVN